MIWAGSGVSSMLRPCFDTKQWFLWGKRSVCCYILYYTWTRPFEDPPEIRMKEFSSSADLYFTVWACDVCLAGCLNMSYLIHHGEQMVSWFKKVMILNEYGTWNKVHFLQNTDTASHGQDLNSWQIKPVWPVVLHCWICNTRLHYINTKGPLQIYTWKSCSPQKIPSSCLVESLTKSSTDAFKSQSWKDYWLKRKNLWMAFSTYILEFAP